MTVALGPSIGARVGFAAVGAELSHILAVVDWLCAAGGDFMGYHVGARWLAADLLAGRHSGVSSFDEPRRLLDDPPAGLLAPAAVPAERAQIAVGALRHGKDMSLAIQADEYVRQQRSRSERPALDWTAAAVARP